MGRSVDAIRKGIIGEQLAKIYFLNQGYEVLSPSTHEKPYDFVVEKNSKFQRVQVKTEVCFGNLVRFRNKHGANNASYKVSDYDILAGVWIDRKQIYLFKSSDINETKYGESLTVATIDGSELRKFDRPTPYEMGII